MNVSFKTEGGGGRKTQRRNVVFPRAIETARNYKSDSLVYEESYEFDMNCVL